MKILKQIDWRTLVLLASLALVISVVSWTNYTIDEYNAQVASEQRALAFKAKQRITFSVDYGPDPRATYRTCFVALSLFLLLSSLKRKLLLSVCFSLFTVFFSILWMVGTIRDLAYTEGYMADSPYLLRIATPYDWIFFSFATVILVVETALMVQWSIERRQAGIQLP